jgi:murein DD-endopeptidase MepM/ murein hydrolase activator NlpD
MFKLPNMLRILTREMYRSSSLAAARWILLLLIGFSLLLAGSSPMPAQAAPPFRLPFQDPSGPSTWLFSQAYGNTISAYRQRVAFYKAGQGLHFGIDLAARCGYQIVAIGDGVVSAVDNLNFGSAPHNLMIDHPNGYASFYGHLLERPDLQVGQPVTAGQVVAKVGDPDLTCTSRPHLHLEIRNAGKYNHTYNPLLLIDADWETLTLNSAAAFGFARDLSEPRQWQSLYDQPEVQFWGAPLNNYAHPWPPNWNP